MPPRARGRGGARGRGSGRGGAASSGRTDTTTQPSEPANAEVVEPSEPAVVPMNEGGAETNVAPTVESQSTASISASPMAAPTSSTVNRPPRQRLDSLKSSEPASRSASPSVRRGASTRGKKPVALPTFSGRRSKEERDARTAADKQREIERNKERDRQAERRKAVKERDAKRLAERTSRGRGGYSGAVSGPFSMQSARQDKRTVHRNFGGSGSGSRATRVKDEDDGSGGPSRRFGGASGGSYIKREGGGEDSSDDENEVDAQFPRKDIDLIELSSDEEDTNAASKLRTHLPVRIGRKEHKERVVGINTDASTETSAKILQEADKAGDALPTNTNGDETSHQTKGKGKANASDLEVTGERKNIRGTGQEFEAEAKIKSEPTSDDEEMVDAEQVGISTDTPSVAKKEESPAAERKPRRREKQPHLQTDEEKAEWARFQANMEHVRAELGPEDDPTVDASGDATMTDAAANASKPSRRDNHVYLFQLPPVIPELKGPSIKKESSNGTSKPSEPQVPKNGEAALVKKEEEFSNPLGSIPEGPTFVSGRVGKLRVHQSGRTTLNWGGVDLELTPGKPASFLQEVVSISHFSEEQQVAPEDGGKVSCFGRVKGKFVVTPDFSSIFG
ncbi:unnamed protein product [Periconia digitata]|uniref:DNA-directed RNA polymerase III RPC4 n=1 Tax=Periconia digitata TaxID=1303443 RepID=A0A9W4UTK6_9PLEO|nr:unnamed protein product [Periconia digitata]